VTLDFELNGLPALVTGAASGIGRETARALAAAGAPVVCADLDGDGAAATADSIGPPAVAMALDTSDRAAVAAAVDSVVERFGRLEIMANIAGIISQGPSVDVTPEELERVLAVNLKGVIWGCQAAGRAMAARRSGSIVNMASGAVDSPAPGLLAYGVAKAGVVQATKAFAAELGPAGVRVNAIAPGFIVTAMTSRHFTNADGTVDEVRRDATFEPMRRMSPLGLIGDPADVAAAVRYLVSPAARFVTGQVIRPNGGVAMPG
jgi:3-oxoacyl-[acyl-carrier protein] reductase